MEVEIDRQWEWRVEREGEDYSDTPGEESSPVPAGRDEMREMTEDMYVMYTQSVAE